MAARTIPGAGGDAAAHDPQGVPTSAGSSLRTPLLDADQAAAHLGVHRSTLDRWARLGQGPYIRVGRRRRYDSTTLRRPLPPLVPHRPDRRHEKLWTTNDVAARLGISASTVIGLTRQGALTTATDTTSRLRFSRGVVTCFAHQQDLDRADAVPANQAAIASGVNVRSVKRRVDAGLLILHRDLTGSAVVHRDDLGQLVGEQPLRPAELSRLELTTHDVAVLLGRCDEWVRQQSISGKLPSRLRPGGYRRFHLDDLPLDDRPGGGPASVPELDGADTVDQKAPRRGGGEER